MQASIFNAVVLLSDAALVVVHTYRKVPSDAVVGMIGSGQLGDWHHMMAHQGVEYPVKSGKLLNQSEPLGK